jgi:hypothetical protein
LTAQVKLCWVTAKGKHNDANEGIGLYTREQQKNTTAFDYFAQIVVGAVVFACGLLYLVIIFDYRSRETIHFGSPELHFVWVYGGWSGYRRGNLHGACRCNLLDKENSCASVHLNKRRQRRASNHQCIMKERPASGD